MTKVSIRSFFINLGYSLNDIAMILLSLFLGGISINSYFFCSRLWPHQCQLDWWFQWSQWIHRHTGSFGNNSPFLLADDFGKQCSVDCHAHWTFRSQPCWRFKTPVLVTITIRNINAIPQCTQIQRVAFGCTTHQQHRCKQGYQVKNCQQKIPN